MPSTVKCIDPTQVGMFWPLARELIRIAVEKTGLSDFDAVEAQVLSGQQLLWIAEHAAATTHLSSNVCTLVACSGRGDWNALITGIEEYARAEGCSVMRIYGRKGWERALPSYRAKYVILDKELN